MINTVDMIANQWNALPGGGEARIYPWIPRFSGLCSNAFLIETARALILIDIGGQAKQAALVADQIRELRREWPRPLLVLLSHAHFDHFIGLCAQPELLDSQLTVVAVQAAGARALTAADLAQTQAALLELSFPPLRVDLPLLAAGEDEGPRSLNCMNGLRLEQSAPWREAGLIVQGLLVEGFALDLIHTPGHSPDHCCLRLGDLVLLGDLLLAANVPGVVGWDQEALLRSLAGMTEIVGGEGIRVVCPGHGPVLLPSVASASLSQVAHAVKPLRDIAALNPERARRLADVAAMALPEVGRLFRIMAGRLYMVSHLMADLGVDGTDAQLQGLIRADLVDQLLEGFSAFSQVGAEASPTPILVAHKAVGVIERLQTAFDREGLGLLLDPSLLRRAERLLSDYQLLVRGFEPVREWQVENLQDVLTTGLAAHQHPPETLADCYRAVTEDTDFDTWLLGRIARRPLLGAVQVDLVKLPSAPSVVMDRERFQDLLTTLIEHLVGTGSKDLRLHTQTHSASQVVFLEGSSHPAGLNNPGSAPRPYLQWLSDLAGVQVTLTSDPAAGRQGYQIHCRPLTL